VALDCGGGERGGAHDWLVVTLLGLLLPELELEPLLEVVAVVVVGVVVVVVVPVLAAVVVVPVLVVPLETEATVEVLRASAGSWPETRTTAINSQAARNRATAPATTRRRIMRTRAARAARIACARPRASVFRGS
jgi:hypothetical protein